MRDEPEKAHFSPFFPTLIFVFSKGGLHYITFLTTQMISIT